MIYRHGVIASTTPESEEQAKVGFLLTMPNLYSHEILLRNLK